MKDQTFAHAAAYIHAEGSLAAQKIAMYADADWERYRASAKRGANIPGWEKHPIYGKYPDYPACIRAKMPPIDKSYKL
jgi:4-hydroxybutyryl-CoA dehydratase/vinylacetyl-CoA-Delta-isomerase